MIPKTSTHKVNCKCPVCRGARGEKWATKELFTTRINSTLLNNIRVWAEENNYPLAVAIEEALDMFLKANEFVPENTHAPIAEESIRVNDDTELTRESDNQMECSPDIGIFFPNRNNEKKDDN